MIAALRVLNVLGVRSWTFYEKGVTNKVVEGSNTNKPKISQYGLSVSDH